MKSLEMVVDMIAKENNLVELNTFFFFIVIINKN